MNIKTAYSTNKAPNGVAAEIKDQLEMNGVKAMLFFASSQYDADAVSAAMQSQYGDIPTFGCTTAGEIVSGKMLDNSVVGMAFNGRIIEDMKIAVLKNISENVKDAVDEAFKSFEAYYNTKMADMDFRKYVGIILIDGLAGAEEQIMDQIGDKSNVMFIGGSAGDDVQFVKTHVFAEGKAYSNAAVLVLIKAATAFDFIKTQSFQNLNKVLVATKVDAAKREVLAFDGRPAVEAYADAVGTSVDAIDEYFMSNPVGLMTGDEPYVRSPQRVEGSGIVFYCNVLEGMELSLLQSGDIVGDTRRALDDKLKTFGPVSGIINFHCILRTLELKNKSLTADYGLAFKDVPTVGFSTYGEEFLGHINQTSTMLVFK
ncbi:MAG: FIST C-terminal domain-containing protein [Deltaproteobacteria bacterium]|nr:FIST C-terminal domain-containing protein [Deltaproteobacteria bacterium]